MMSLESRDFGDLGSEFRIKHGRLQFQRFCLALILFPILASFIDLYSQEPFSLWLAVIFLFVVLFIRLYTKVIAETLLILPKIGLQIQTEYWLGMKATEFMEISCVKDVIINEAIRPYKIVCYLAVLISDKNSSCKTTRIQPLFLHSWPKLETLKKIYCDIQGKLVQYQKVKSL